MTAILKKSYSMQLQIQQCQELLGSYSDEEEGFPQWITQHLGDCHQWHFKITYQPEQCLDKVVGPLILYDGTP